MDTKKNIEIYQADDGQTQVNVRIEQESVWLNRQQLAGLFARDIKTIGKHINNIFREGELVKDAVVAKFATTASDEKNYQVEHYNLDVIISVGYRVKSLQGTQFRIWATARLKELLLQGYSLHQQRFEQNAKALKQALKLIEKTAKSPDLTLDAGRGLTEIVSRYTQTFLWLHKRMMKVYWRNLTGRQAVNWPRLNTLCNPLKIVGADSISAQITNSVSAPTGMETYLATQLLEAYRPQ